MLNIFFCGLLSFIQHVFGIHPMLLYITVTHSFSLLVESDSVSMQVLTHSLFCLLLFVCLFCFLTLIQGQVFIEF